MKRSAVTLLIVCICAHFALAVSFLRAESASMSTGSQADEKEQSLLAAGQVGRPSTPSFPAASTPAVGSSVKASSPVIGPADLFPVPKREAAKTETEAQEKPGSDVTKPLNELTVEYSEDLAAPSNLPGLSVVQALNQALINGPRAAAVRAQLAIARANFPAATQAPNPIFFLDRGLVAEQVNRIGPSLTIDPPWKLFFRLLIAKRLVAQTKVDLLTTIWSLRNDVRRAYIEVVVAQETQKTLIDLYELSARLLNITSKRFNAGDVPELDVLKARLAAAQAQVDVGVGKKRVTRARQQLNILMGRPPETPLNVPALPEYTSNEPRIKLRAQKSDILPDFDRPVPPLKEFIERALQNRLELRSLDLQIKLNKANLAGAYGNVVPDPNFAFGKSTTGNPPTGPKVTAVFMTLNAEFPLSNWNQGSIYQLKATRNQLNYQIAAERNQVTGDVSSAYNNLLAARKKIRVYQDRLLLDSNEVARLAQRSYAVGQSDITSTLQAQQANVQTRSAYLDAVNSYSGAFTDLEFAVGKPLQ
jgi:outer membrane protein, heavy metal efflux system